MPNGGPLIAAPKLPDQPLYELKDYSWDGGGARKVLVIARHPNTGEVVGEADEFRLADNLAPIIVRCDLPQEELPGHVMCECHYCFPT